MSSAPLTSIEYWNRQALCLRLIGYTLYTNSNVGINLFKFTRTA